MLHAEPQHPKCRVSPACIAPYPMCALINWGQSLHHSCQCSHTSSVPHCPTLQQMPTQLFAVGILSLELSLSVSASPTHTDFERSPPPHLQTFSCDVTQLRLSWHRTQQTPVLLRTNLEPQCQRAAVSHDGNMAHLTSTETEKISRPDCIKGGGKPDQVKCWDKSN